MRVYYSSAKSHVQITTNKTRMRKFIDVSWQISDPGEVPLFPMNPYASLCLNFPTLAKHLAAHAAPASTSLHCLFLRQPVSSPRLAILHSGRMLMLSLPSSLATLPLI